MKDAIKEFLEMIQVKTKYTLLKNPASLKTGQRTWDIEELSTSGQSNLTKAALNGAAHTAR